MTRKVKIIHDFVHDSIPLNIIAKIKQKDNIKVSELNQKDLLNF